MRHTLGEANSFFAPATAMGALLTLLLVPAYWRVQDELLTPLVAWWMFLGDFRPTYRVRVSSYKFQRKEEVSGHSVNE